MGVLRGLLAIAHDDVQEHLLVLGDRLALLGDEVLGLLAQLLIHAQRILHRHFDLLDCLVHFY